VVNMGNDGKISDFGKFGHIGYTSKMGCIGETMSI